MREIKFRSWDGAEMHYDVSIINGNAFKNEKYIGEPMQYTGLKDKNGKEIFEGDILKGEDNYNHGHPFSGTVGFRDGSFVIIGDVITHYRWMDYSVEIIGNIHDNPELLEV